MPISAVLLTAEGSASDVGSEEKQSSKQRLDGKSSSSLTATSKEQSVLYSVCILSVPVFYGCFIAGTAEIVLNIEIWKPSMSLATPVWVVKMSTGNGYSYHYGSKWQVLHNRP